MEGIRLFFQIYYLILIGRIILSWFMMAGGGTNSTLDSIYQILYGLTEPLLAPIRNIIPPVRMGMGYLDLSPLILLVLLRIVQSILYRALI